MDVPFTTQDFGTLRTFVSWADDTQKGLNQDELHSKKQQYELLWKPVMW